MTDANPHPWRRPNVVRAGATAHALINHIDEPWLYRYR